MNKKILSFEDFRKECIKQEEKHGKITRYACSKLYTACAKVQQDCIRYTELSKK